MRTMHRKFSMGFWSQSLRQKFAQSCKFGRAPETWISKNSLESHFSFNKKCLVSRAVMNQNALYSPELVECFTYSERMRTTDRKFYTGLWSQTLHQKNAQEALPNLPLCASFWRRVWLQKPVESFLCVGRICSEYVKHSPRSGKYSALWCMTIRHTKHFLLKEKWLSNDFFEIQVSEGLPNLPLCVSFWRRLWLQKPVEFFYASYTYILGM